MHQLSFHRLTIAFTVCVLGFIVLSCNSDKVAVVTDYSVPYKFNRDIQNDLADDSDPYRFQLSAADYAMKSDYKNALKVWDIAMPFRSRAISPEVGDSLMAIYSSVDAIDYIVSASDTHDVVILNEAHHNSLHRMFARELLEGLYQKGYRYFGLEALSNGTYQDTLLQDRAYAVYGTGHYVRDPQFSNLLREAISLGFEIFAYEETIGTRTPPEREEEQSSNIARYMQSHTDGKYFIYCGFDHGLEGPHRSWGKTMAGLLKEKTGIDPLTIDQVKYSERSSDEFNNPLLKLIKPAGSSVLVDINNKPYQSFKGSSYADIAVFHPIHDANDFRPAWFNRMNQLEYIPGDDLIPFDEPYFILAFKKGEDIEMAVPYDLIEIDTGLSQSKLALEPGRYTIVALDSESNALSFPVNIKP